MLDKRYKTLFRIEVIIIVLTYSVEFEWWNQFVKRVALFRKSSALHYSGALKLHNRCNNRINQYTGVV